MGVRRSVMAARRKGSGAAKGRLRSTATRGDTDLRLAASRQEIDSERDGAGRPVAARADGRSQQIRGLICKNL